jgi:predicted AlkP superfamily pyrophosphatase or phosphodiesterase
MRYDFIFEKVSNLNEDKTKIKHPRMPFINRLINEKKAKPFKLSAKPPTVTLPRLKVNILLIIEFRYFI